MTYKKRFTNKSGISSPIGGGNSNTGAWNGSPGQNGSSTGGWNNHEMGYKNYMSRLPEVYTGHPNRIERYNQYEMMENKMDSMIDKLDQNNTYSDKLVKAMA